MSQDITTTTAFPRYDSYKDSGVEWLGQIPEHWSDVIRTKFICRTKTGEKDTQDTVENGIYPFFVRSQRVRRTNTFSFDGEGVLTPGDGAIGQIFHYSNGKIEFHQRVYLFFNFKQTQAKFFFYFIKAHLFYEVIGLSAKSTVDSLRLPMVQNFPIPLPPRKEQERIATFLDERTAAIDNAIAKKQRLLTLLDEQRAILIQRCVTRGLDSNVPLKDSGIEWLGQIPEHWEVRKLKFLFKEIDMRTQTGEETLLSLRMYRGLVPHHDVSDKKIESENLIGYKKVKPNQIVMNRMRAAIGIFGLAYEHGLVSPDYAILESQCSLLHSYFIRLFKVPKMMSKFRTSSRGMGTGSSGFMRLYFEQFGNISVPLPPLDEQKAIVAHLEAYEQQHRAVVEATEREIELLKEYKQTLIASAVTGQIRV